MSDPLENIPCLKDWAGKKICVQELVEGVPVKLGSEHCEVALYFPGVGGDSTMDIDFKTDEEWADVKRALQAKIKRAEAHNFPGQELILEGAIAGPGVFGNPYRFGQLKVFFNQARAGDALPMATFLDICTFYGLPAAPVVKEDIPVEEFVLGQTLEELSNGKCLLLNGIRRYGISIRAMDGSEGMSQVSSVWKGG